MTRRLATSSLTISTLVALVSIVCHAQSLPPVTHHIPATVLTGQAQPVGRLPATQSLRLVLVLPLRNQAALDSFLQKLYDPSSPSYRQFLTVDEFAAMFGPSQEDYDRVISFAESNGFTVVGTSRNRVNIDVMAPVASIEQAFHVTMNVHRDTIENRTFYAPDREPSPNMPVQLWRIAGLENHSIPRPALHRAAQTSVPNATTGSGPSSSFLGSDMRAAYYGGTLTGAGQSLGLFEPFGTDLRDLQTYYRNVHQTNSVPITILSTDGTSTTCLASSGCDDAEQTLDMTQALGMAPGLSSLVMYVGSTDAAVFNAMATANPLNSQLSSSWTFSPADPNIDEPYFQEFAAQGQNLFQVVGDTGAWGPSSVAWPADDAFVTSVGGTDLQTTKAGGQWSSETAWIDGGGGISPNNLAIPSWQTNVASGCSTCSRTFRNGPDVSANANFSFYVCANRTTCTANQFGGTSFAAPMWAGYLALVNQAAVANGGRPLGFINPTLYAIGSGSSYATAFHDITSGSNGFSATIGYDLATGWGSPNGSGLLNALLAPPGFSLSAAPASQSVVQGTNGNYTVNVTPSGGFSSNVTLSVSGVPSGASASLSPNPVAGGGSPNLSVNAGSAALGTYTLTINASGGGISHTTSVTLSIIPPPIVVTVTPPETILYSGQTQQFTATVMNTTNTAVTWALNPNTGSISSSGLYTAPSLISSQQAVTVSATSVADTTKTSSATIILIPSTPWYNTFWTNRKVLLINHSKVSGSTNLTNFPMLLSVTDANLESTANGGGVGKSDGSDILFTASDGVTKLNHEIESYNPSTGQLIAWVQIPTLSPTLDTVIYIYYGNASASNQQNATGVWDSNFKGVWHLPNGTSLSASDSTSGGSNGTVSGASAVAGEIDGGASFTGTSQISFHDSNQPSGTSARTLSSWISSTSANNSIYFNYGDGTTNGAMVYLGVYDLGDGFAHEAIVGVGGGNSNLGSHVNVNDGLWHYVVATDDGSNNWKMYVDGVLTNSATPLGVTTNTSVNHTATFGTADNGTQAYTGLMDEMRVSSIARSADWIKTEYNNQSSPATFVSQGAAQNP